MEAMLRELVDRQAIHEVVLRYARAADRLDWELAASCFHDDGIMDASFWKRRAHDEYADRLTGRSKGHIGDWAISTAHYMINCLIEIDGDSASAETYCVAFHRTEGGSLPAPVRDAGALGDGRARDVWMGIRYVDRFERRDAAWKIAERVLIFDWTRVDPVGETLDPTGLHAGRRDRTDLAYSSPGGLGGRTSN